MADAKIWLGRGLSYIAPEWTGCSSPVEVGTGCDGRALHAAVSADRWCVTRRDLRHLRHEVRKAILRGEIRPTDLDRFDPRDTTFGPTIYTVNEQFIKPVTARAGNMSWALMRHPGGLQCDLFVTHAWQEGIFEFVDKVLHSWPSGTRHAWCCMLANPQNLSISDLIETPISSPFALALHSATKMLVVPNQQASIYTRLWCAYEAYLAHQWEKVILTAAGNTLHVTSSLLVSLLSAALGCCAGILLADYRAGVISMTFELAIYPLIVGSVLSGAAKYRRIFDLAGAFWSAYNLSLLVCLHDCPDVFGFGGHRSVFLWAIWRDSQIELVASLVLFFCISEWDRMKTERSFLEAEMLKRSYTGSIGDATCSSASDAAHIRAEIGGCTAEVDSTISQLINAGMSTASLRAAADAGVEVERFDCFGYGFVVLVLGTATPTTMTLHGFHGLGILGVLDALIFFPGLMYLGFWCRSDIDAKMFSYLALQKVVLLVQRPPQIIVRALWRLNCVHTSTMMEVHSFSDLCMWAAVLTLSLAGIHRVSRLPCVGRFLAQFLVARGRAGVRKAFCVGLPHFADTDGDDDDDDEAGSDEESADGGGRSGGRRRGSCDSEDDDEDGMTGDSETSSLCDGGTGTAAAAAGTAAAGTGDCAAGA